MDNVIKDDTLDVKDALKQSRHGDAIKTSDGGYGIVIDQQEEMDAKKPESVRHIEDVLETQKNTLNDIKANKAVESLQISQEDINRQHDMVAMYKDDPKLRDHYDAIKKLADISDDWEPSLNGLSPKNSAEAQKFNAAISANDDGSFDVTGIDPELLKQNAIDEYNKMQATKEEQQRTEKIAQEYIDDVEKNGVTTQFNVPEGEVRSFIDTLPGSSINNVVRSKTIVVNEVKKKTVPTKIRKITDASEFKRIVSRKVHSEVETVALPNSGYFATFKGCGSLAMATLVPDNQGEPVDYAKRYQFIYDNLVGTSIGKLSYTEFCAYTAVADLDLCIFAILRASDPDENAVTLICGDDDCKREYEVKYKLSKLMNIDSLDDETLEQTKRIVDAKDIYENARKVFEESPMMQVKAVDITDNTGMTITLNIKQPNGTVVIERTPIMRDIAQAQSRYVAALLLYVTSVSVDQEEDGEIITYEVDDPHSIAQAIADLDDDSISAFTKVLQDLKEYKSPTYSFKGPFECPNCHRKDDTVSCDINTLVFQKVSKGIR